MKGISVGEEKSCVLLLGLTAVALARHGFGILIAGYLPWPLGFLTSSL
jgi:hypothetical protein